MMRGRITRTALDRAATTLVEAATTGADGSAPRGGAMPVIELAEVTRRFGDVTAVDALSLTIERGETVALLGPNGAGKTTAIELLLGLVAPDAGSVRLFGRSPAAAIAGGHVGAMLQDAGLPDGVKVAE